ncbi:hypothetical protein VTO58DRAFT_102032 [Aureobasidium pullulans]|nr:hypothetical protein JADG_005378 [Aureobasidium pullulans]THX59041.1 hypothetical protein D6D06_02427 [Aureobasidium pullulans]
MFIQVKYISGVRPASSSFRLLIPVNNSSSSKSTRFFHASATFSGLARDPRRRTSIPRNNTNPRTKTQQSDIMKIVQDQHNISQTQFKILKVQETDHQTTLEIMKMQHNNYHTMMEITGKMEQIVHNIILTKEDVQISDKIAFSAGFGCGLLVCLAIWISPFGGKDKDEDAEK